MTLLLFPFVISAAIGWTPATSTVAFDNASAVAFAEKEFAGTPLMAIARCESQLKHWDEGGHIVQGIINHQDVGILQLNVKYHMKDATRLGYDILSAEGNILYARYLYEQKGTVPWSASKECWSPKLDSVFAKSP